MNISKRKWNMGQEMSLLEDKKHGAWLMAADYVSRSGEETREEASEEAREDTLARKKAWRLGELPHFCEFLSCH
jgi:hypothetical protein